MLLISSWELQEIVEMALREDLGADDLTTRCILLDNDVTVTACIYAKQPAVLAGLEVACTAFHILDPTIIFQAVKKDGEHLEKGIVVARLRGPAAPVLSGERVALNFLQRLSGIATYTASLVDLIESYRARVTDTRKTTPGLRCLEKYAVTVGGGINHRFGLDGGILIKDNHVQVAGGIKEAVKRARSKAPHTFRIEVEVETLDQLREALEAGAEIILLDNMNSVEMAEAVKINNGRALLEASGGITEGDLVDTARTGVDFISVGALTHSVKAVDFSLEITEIEK